MGPEPRWGAAVALLAGIGGDPGTRPVAVQAGDTLRVTCTHDASLRQRLPELRRLPPRYVVWSDGASDEMCLGAVIWSSP